MTVAELYERMTAQEFTEWLVFDKIEREDEEKAYAEAERKNRMRR